MSELRFIPILNRFPDGVVEVINPSSEGKTSFKLATGSLTLSLTNDVFHQLFRPVTESDLSPLEERYWKVVVQYGEDESEPVVAYTKLVYQQRIDQKWVRIAHEPVFTFEAVQRIAQTSSYSLTYLSEEDAWLQDFGEHNREIDRYSRSEGFQINDRGEIFTVYRLNGGAFDLEVIEPANRKNGQPD